MVEERSIELRENAFYPINSKVLFEVEIAYAITDSEEFKTRPAILIPSPLIALKALLSIAMS